MQETVHVCIIKSGLNKNLIKWIFDEIRLRDPLNPYSSRLDYADKQIVQLDSVGIEVKFTKCR